MQVAVQFTVFLACAASSLGDIGGYCLAYAQPFIDLLQCVC